MTKKSPTGYCIKNCQITNTNAPANEHTRAVVVALAAALEANANAIAETARALKGGAVTMGNGILTGA